MDRCVWVRRLHGRGEGPPYSWYGAFVEPEATVGSRAAAGVVKTVDFEQAAAPAEVMLEDVVYGAYLQRP